jgi:hypothetical protein
MMKTITLLLASLTILQAEPSALTDMRKVYETEQKKIDEKYIKWLVREMDKVTGLDKQPFRDEIEKITGEKNPSEDKEVDENWGKLVKIDSQELEGYKIGRLKAGDVVKIQYVSGIWRAYGGWREESPDNANTDQHKLAFVLSTNQGETIITTPQNTKSEPFEYTIIESGNYYIRMNDPAADSNSGVVQYRIEVK